MQNRIRIIGTWLIVAVAVSSAFAAGAGLRSWQAHAPKSAEESPQTYALLKLTPECSPVSADSITRDPSASDDRKLVSEVLGLLKLNYVEPITAERETEMARGAVKGMLDSLKDPDSRFLDPAERKLLDDAASGRFRGIGAVMALKTKNVDDMEVTNIIVVAPMPGSPAESAGLKAGDAITHIDGTWIVGHDPFQEPEMKELLRAAQRKEIDESEYEKAHQDTLTRLREAMAISEALDVLSSRSSGDVKLTVERPGSASPTEVKLSCKITEVAPVVSKALKNDIAYIRVSQFNAQAAKDFTAELDRARSAGAKGLVLDLRNNPGGLLDSAAEVTRRITGGGVIATIQQKNNKRTIRMPRVSTLDMPVVVLINAGTSSVAELAAGSMRDSGVATLVGAKTFGDGRVQTPVILQDGSAAVVTTGKMLTAKGHDFEGKGVSPDKEITQQGRNDSQLQEAENILLARLRKA